MLVFLSGLFAGSLHVLGGPDHLAALAPLTVRSPRAGSLLGAVWGLGHGGGIFVWLLLTIALRRWYGRELPPAALEALVGASLIALGAFSFAQREHAASSEHGGHVTAFALGALHGSAGASHLFALLPTLGLPPHGILSYGGGYLLAGVIAMAGVGTLLGRLSTRLNDARAVRRGCALLVIALGTFWLLQAAADLA